MGIKTIAKVKNGEAEVKLLIKHPMRMTNEKKGIKPKFIQELTVTYKGKTVYTMYPSMGISENPFIKFSFKGAQKDDSIEVYWKDNEGAEEKGEFKLK
jgi:sulfur-oxidizing protein SoxZ